MHGDAQTMLLGNVEIDRLLLVMKEQLPFVQKKTRSVFEKEISGWQTQISFGVIFNTVLTGYLLFEGTVRVNCWSNTLALIQHIRGS